MRILISGAGVAGPVAAYWLARAGHRVTIVERSPQGRDSVGHAVDLFTPAVRVVERMGVLDAVRDHRTGTEEMVFRRAGARRAVTIDASRLMGALSDRHVEILREDLSAILYRATARDVEYVFDDTAVAITDDGSDTGVAFARGPARRFDVVLGADGLHSGVRRIVFGPEERYARWIGGYIAVAAVPAGADLGNRMTGVIGANRMVGVYSARHLDDARAFFLFRPPAELRYDHRDVARQKQLLRAAFAGLDGPDGLDGEVPRLLDEVDAATGFYFDAVTQLVMDRWTRGRVALVGDAAWCPGPAVGGSTSLAVVGAYTLAAELAAAGDDTARAFAAYEEAMTPYVLRSRRFAVGMAKRLVPGSGLGVRALTTGTALFTRLPAPLRRRLVALGGDLGLHESVAIPDVPGLPADRSTRPPAANDPDRHP